MALTPVEEGQIRGLLDYYSGLLAVGQDANDLLAALAPDDTAVPYLPEALTLGRDDVMYVVRNGGADEKVSVRTMSKYIGVSKPEVYFMGQN